MSLRGSIVVVTSTVLPLSCSRAAEETAWLPPALRSTRLPLQRVPGLACKVESGRSEFGVPHILVQNLAGAGFDMGYSQMEDCGIEVVKLLSAGRGDLALHEGRGALSQDAYSVLA